MPSTKISQRVGQVPQGLLAGRTATYTSAKPEVPKSLVASDRSLKKQAHIFNEFPNSSRQEARRQVGAARAQPPTPTKCERLFQPFFAPAAQAAPAADSAVRGLNPPGRSPCALKVGNVAFRPSGAPTAVLTASRVPANRSLCNGGHQVANQESQGCESATVATAKPRAARACARSLIDWPEIPDCAGLSGLSACHRQHTACTHAVKCDEAEPALLQLELLVARPSSLAAGCRPQMRRSRSSASPRPTSTSSTACR